MRKIILSAGHTSIGLDKGASSPYGIEGVEVEEFRKLVVKELKALGVTPITDGNNTVLADSIREFKKVTDEDAILVEFHMNAATPTATGTETLIPDSHTQLEKDIATEISKSISDTLEIRNRGVKTEAQSARGKLGWMRNLIGSNILPEICFISNKSDMEKYNKNKVILAKNIAEILFKYAKEDDLYTVVKGDTLSKIAAKYRTTITKIKRDNNLTSDLIQIGQKLKV